MCDFCNNNILQKQSLFFNDIAGFIYPRKPVIFGHVMLVPKRHVEYFYDLTDIEIIEMRNLIKKLFEGFKNIHHATGFNLFTNNGQKADQHIPHVHWQIFMRFNNEKYSPYDVLNGKIDRENISSLDKEWEKRKDRIAKLIKH